MGIFASTFNFGDFPFIFALILILLCFVLSLFVFNFTFPESVGGGSGGGKKKKKVGCCSCECKSMAVTAATAPSSYMNGGGGEVVLERVAPAVQAAGERQIGASMMEQLVPEITTHALSYLDFPSLCRLSMTNSSMRKAANDDNAWKALYHKDFTTEQDSVTPPNGWKAYYAATRAIVNINTEFFNIIREKDFQEMSRLWLNADYVKCVHASGELFTGYNAVMGSWQIVFNWEPGVNFQVQEVRARVLTNMAWVTMKAYVDMEQDPLNVTNVFEFHNGHWYMVHHHSSVMLNNGVDDQPHMLA